MTSQTIFQSGENERDHGLDALRAAMMFLGVYLHAACAYTTVGGVWFFQDSQTGLQWDLQCLFIHIFRMPVFFVLSGYFSALVARRRGMLAYFRNRMLRIGIPLVLFLIVLSAILRPLALFGRIYGKDPSAGGRALEMLAKMKFLFPPDAMHLWFMAVLLWLLPLACALDFVLRGTRGVATDQIFRRLVSRIEAPAMLAIPTFFTLLPMENGILETPDLQPDLRILTAYGLFFAFGWMLFRNRELLRVLREGPWKWLGFATAATGVNFYFLGVQLRDLKVHDMAVIAATAASTALVMWSMIFALVGFAQRYWNHADPVVRWLADSSYWLYLAHPVALLSFQILLKPVTLPPIVKLPLTLIPSIAMLLGSYELLVRRTWLGALLNGMHRTR